MLQKERRDIVFNHINNNNQQFAEFKLFLELDKHEAAVVERYLAYRRQREGGTERGLGKK